MLRHGANTVAIFNYQTRENHHTYTDRSYWEVLLVKRYACTPPKLHQSNDSLTHCSRSTSANQLLHASAAADLQIAILSVTCIVC